MELTMEVLSSSKSLSAMVFSFHVLLRVLTFPAGAVLDALPNRHLLPYPVFSGLEPLSL
jgi:hypothetical protein